MSLTTASSTTPAGGPDYAALLGQFAGSHVLALLAFGVAAMCALAWLVTQARQARRMAMAVPVTASAELAVDSSAASTARFAAVSTDASSACAAGAVARAANPATAANARRWLPLRVGAAVLIVAALLFGVLADELGDGDAVERFDIALAATLRAGLDDRVLHAMSWLTLLGNGPVVTAMVAVVAAALLAARQWRLAIVWSVALAGNGMLLTPALKRIFERARPLRDHAYAVVDGYSFPSGHASGSMVFFGMLAFLAARLLDGAARTAAVAAALSLLLLVGASRVLLQVHYASDVLAGYAVGAAWLVIWVSIADATEKRR